MNTHIGKKETSAATIIFSLIPAFSVLIGTNSVLLGSGALINCVICYLISLVLMLPLKLYFRKVSNPCLVDSSAEIFGKFFSWCITLVFVCLIFFLAVFSVSSLSQTISSLNTGKLKADHIRAAFCVSVATCAFLGAEALTRQSYILFNIVTILITIIIISTFKGLNLDNLYPLFGNSLKTTFSNYYPFCLLSGLGPFLLICNHIEDKKGLFGSVYRFVTISFVITFVMFLFYSLSVSKTLGTFFGASLEAIFASASSGSFFHRFELFFSALYVILAIASSSFSVLTASYAISKISKANDHRPFVLILSTILYSLSDYTIKAGVYIGVCLVLSFISLLLPMFISVINKNRG